MLITLSVLYCALLVASAPEVYLGKTRLIGRDVTGLQQDFFGGIPFAEPPIGALRFQRPILKVDIDADVFDAQNFGLPCLQRDLPADAMSEDCLTVNVFRPKVTSTDLLPVMFWTHGDGFFSGASSSFNGSNIVAQSVSRGTPVVYVNHNYRLGPLGFPQGQEADSSGRLNLGAKDQIAALEWVQQNIGLFGGDKSKVTIFGESAGAMLTNLLFLMPSVSNLARAAIFESGVLSFLVIYNASTREPAWQNFVAGTPGCESVANTQSTFDCLLQANTSAIYQGFVESYALAIETFPFVPTLDGPSSLLPDLPPHLWEKGEFTGLLFISGANLDEGIERSLCLPLSIEPASSILLGETMVEYWISFATSLDPNDGLGISRPIWPQYTPENEVLLQLHGENITVILDDYRKEQIEFLKENADVFNR